MDTTTANRDQKKENKLARRWPLLVLSITLMALSRGGPILTRVYFLHGGTRLWLSSFIQIAGWPIVLLPLAVSYVRRTRQLSWREAKIMLATPPIVAACVALGVITGVDCYLYAYGSSYLPVSTSGLIFSTQLIFTAAFAYLIVRQKFTPYSINAVVLLVIGAVVLGLHSNSDRPVGESNGKYYLGFVMTIGAAALYGLLLPLIELTYMKMKQKVTYTVVMEMQMLMSIFATAFCLVGMVANKDFQAIEKEAREYGLGRAKYYMVLVFGAIFWQFFNLGFVGVIWCSSSLLAGVVLTVLLPVRQVLAVILLNEKFNSAKGIDLALSLWGFVSYLYGEWSEMKKMKNVAKAETSPSADV